MLKTKIALLTIMLISGLSICWGEEPEEEKTVIVTGVADGKTVSSRDEALNDALREAVEQGVGFHLISESIVENYALIKDKILTRVNGYVKKYSILEEKAEGDSYKVKIKATVGLSKLKSDLIALKLLQVTIGRPKIMVMVAERIDKRLQEDSYSQVEIEDAFLQKEFDLVNKEQFEKLKAKDIEACFDDYDKASAIARNQGAQVLIVGKGSANFAEKSDVYEMPFIFYNANMQVKVIEAQTARLVASKSEKGKWGSENKEDAGITAFQKAGKKIAPELIDSIITAWQKDVYESAPYELIITGINPEQLRNLQVILETARGVKSVSRRSFTNNIAFIDLRYAGPSFALEERLLEINNPKLEIVSTDWNKLELKVKR